jgi:hypothetical protein
MAETKNPGLVKEVMGHESLTTTVGYLHPETAQIKVVIDRLNRQKYVMWQQSQKQPQLQVSNAKRMDGRSVRVFEKEW